jgi:predicted transcriptional regulator
MSTTRFTARLEEDLKEQILQLAHSTGRCADSLFNETMREYLERWQIADIEQGLRELEAGDIANPEEAEAVFVRITTSEAMARADTGDRRVVVGSSCTKLFGTQRAYIPTYATWPNPARVNEVVSKSQERPF